MAHYTKIEDEELKAWSPVVSNSKTWPEKP